MFGIVPKLSNDPLRSRRINESLIAYYMEIYAHTLAELALSKEEWEATFKMLHPGPGYTATMKVQQAWYEHELSKYKELIARFIHHDAEDLEA